MASQKNPIFADVMSMNEEVTGSCNLVVVRLPNDKKIRFIVDFGLYQEKPYEKYNSKMFFKPENLDFAIITHTHIDHIGKLPLLSRNGFNGKIFISKEASYFLAPALGDTYKILKSNAKAKNKPAIYCESDVEKVLEKISPQEIGKRFTVSENIKVTLLKNGHSVGATLVLIEIKYKGYESINLLFTGDYNKKNKFFFVNKIPKWIRKLPITIVCESTYGSVSSNEIEACYTKNIQKFLKENKNGTIITPVFSFGRAQEILYEIKLLQKAGKISEDIPIYYDGKLSHKYTDIYLKEELGFRKSMLDFLPNNLIYVNEKNREDVFKFKGAKIIVSSSGMGTHGPSQGYIKHFLSETNALIHFSGYVAEGTLGRRIKKVEQGEEISIDGILIKKRANVEYTSEFSTHAKSDELIELLNQFEKVNMVLINHGSTKSRKDFAEKVLKTVKTKNVEIFNSRYFFRINPYGLVKKVTTKFE